MNLDSSSFEKHETHIPFEEIQELVNNGATSSSYKVRIHNKWHFLKRPKSEFADNSLYISAFEKEFDLGYTLDHPNIVRYLSKGVDKDGIYILTEFVDGLTLTDFIKSNPEFSENRKEFKRLLLQVCDALKYLHSHNIVHYDLKPDNIIITRNGHNVKLVDLGFSYSDCYSAIKCGTKTFSSPEQFQNPEVCDIRSDIYSFGKIIEFIFQGKRLPSKYKSVHSKATQISANDRFSNIDELTYKLNQRKNQRFIYLFLIVFMLGYLIYSLALVNKRKEESPTKDAVISIFPDTLDNSYDTMDETSSSLPSPESVSVDFFRKELSEGHLEYFSNYYYNCPNITTQEEYITALGLCDIAFNKSRAIEDSLMSVYIINNPSLERQFRKIAEEEMAASMSKHLSMLRKYIDSINKPAKD